MNFLKAKSKRSKILALITLGIIVILAVLNFLLSIVGHNKSVYVDLTPEGLYTVSDGMKKECEFIDSLAEKNPDQKIKIIFCNDPDKLRENTITRVPYFMSLKLASIFDLIEVEEINVNFNPTAVAKYKATSLTEIATTDVIVAYGNRYRILGADHFWGVGSEGEIWSYDGERTMATVLKSLALANDSNPAAYFLYDSSDEKSKETVAPQQLRYLLAERGLRVEFIDVSKVDKIPEDCALLIINNPQKDLSYDKDKLGSFNYVSDTEKIDRYLVGKQGALMVAKDPARSLPVLEAFLHEWGFDFSESILSVPKNENDKDSSDRTTNINAVYNTNKESFGHAIYGEFADLPSSPNTMFVNTGYISCGFGSETTITEPGSLDVTKTYISFLTSPDSSIPYKVGTNNIVENEKGSYDVAAVVARDYFDSYSAEKTFSYVFCANSAEFFSDELLGNGSLANYDVLSALVNNISRVDLRASTSLGGSSLNTELFGGKQLVSTTLTEEDENIYSSDATEILGVNRGIDASEKVVITLCVAIAPVAALVFGIIISVKRKFL